MFTGLIETVGRVAEIRRGRAATSVAIESDLPVKEMNEGESVAVDGVCLTVTRRAGARFWVDVIPETLSRTRFGRLRVGSRVNLERSLRLGDRLGGHLVQGHVDATVKVLDVIQRGGDYRLVVERPPSIARYLAEKGSVALQGVSLTVAGVGRNRFEVALIPETLARTTLSEVRAGSALHVEVDLLARYLEGMLEASGRSGGG